MPATARRSAIDSINAFARGGILSVVRLLAGFGRTKYIALMLGPAGVGVLAQANQFQLLTVTLGSLSMAVGIINALSAANHDGDPARARRVVGTAFVVQLALSLLIMFLGLIFARPVSRLIYDSDTPLWSVAILAALPLAVGASGFLEGVLFGSNRYDLYVRGSVVATVLAVGAQVALIHWFGLSGAFAGYPLSSAILFTTFVILVRRFRPVRDTFVFAWDIREFVRLLRFSGTILLNSALGYGAALFVRRAIIVRLGVDGNGVLQVPLALSAYYAPFVTNGLWGRLHPFVSARADSVEARHELNHSLQIAAGLTLVYVVGVNLLRRPLVAIAYSASFAGSLPLIPIQAGGDFPYFVAFTLGVYLLAAGRLGPYLFGWVLYYVTFATLAVRLVPHFALSAPPLAHLLASTLVATIGVADFAIRGLFSWRSGMVIAIAGILVTAHCFAALNHSFIGQVAAAVAAAGVVLALWRSMKHGPDHESSPA